LLGKPAGLQALPGWSIYKKTRIAKTGKTGKS